MNPKTTDGAEDEDSLGVLDDAASLDTTGIGILGATAQVTVDLPRDEDDALADDGVVEGEVYSELVVDEEPLPVSSNVGRIQEGGAEIIIELPAILEVDDDDENRKPETPAKAAQAEAPLNAESPVAKSVSDVAPVEEAVPTQEDANQAAADSVASEDAFAPTQDTSKATEAASKTKPRPKKAPIVTEEPVAPVPPAVAAARARQAATVPVASSASQVPTSSASQASASDESGSIATAVRTGGSEASRIAEKANTVSTEQNNAKKSDAALAPRGASARSDVALTSKRLDELGEASRETADLLTADRLLDPHRVTKPEPEGAWSHFLYTISGRRINIGDGKRARARKELSARIAAPLAGGARFVPVLSRKGGVGKTTITTLLGMALADARDDRVIAVDANPDRGTLADRIVRAHSKSVRDLVRIHEEVKGYHDISAIVARDATRLDVLASDSDPRIADAFSDSDYRDVAGVAAHYYSLVLTDTGTGIVHSVMEATLDLADQLIIVSGLSVDEARLASETLTWLESNGYAEQAREAVIVLNQSTPGSPLVRLNELEAHFATRAKHVVRMPYDSQIAGGGAIVFANLQQETRQAARELAALLVEGLRARAA